MSSARLAIERLWPKGFSILAVAVAQKMSATGIVTLAPALTAQLTTASRPRHGDGSKRACRSVISATASRLAVLVSEHHHCAEASRSHALPMVRLRGRLGTSS